MEQSGTKARAKKVASIAQWDALLARYPLGSAQDLVRELVVILASNGTVLYLLVKGRMQPLGLVLLVGLEAILLTAIAWMQSLQVPPSALMEKRKSPRESLPVFLFGLVWLGLVYGFTFGPFLDDVESLQSLMRQPVETLRRSGLLWPLGLTLFGAVLDARRDSVHWSRHGGYFLSTPGINATARWLTLFLGGIPFFIPIAVVAWVVVTLFERLSGRRGSRSAAAPSGLGVLVLLPALCLGVFGVMLWLLLSGVSGWAIGYCSAALVSELVIGFLPLIATKARAEEAAELGGRKPSSRASHAEHGDESAQPG